MKPIVNESQMLIFQELEHTVHMYLKKI